MRTKPSNHLDDTLLEAAALKVGQSMAPMVFPLDAVMKVCIHPPAFLTTHKGFEINAIHLHRSWCPNVSVLVRWSGTPRKVSTEL